MTDAESRPFKFHLLSLKLSRALVFFSRDTCRKHLSCLGGETGTWVCCTRGRHGSPNFFFQETSRAQTLPITSLIDTDNKFRKLIPFVFSFIITDFYFQLISLAFLFGAEGERKRRGKTLKSVFWVIIWYCILITLWAEFGCLFR